MCIFHNKEASIKGRISLYQENKVDIKGIINSDYTRKQLRKLGKLKHCQCLQASIILCYLTAVLREDTILKTSGHPLEEAIRQKKRRARKRQIVTKSSGSSNRSVFSISRPGAGRFMVTLKDFLQQECP